MELGEEGAQQLYQGLTIELLADLGVATQINESDDGIQLTQVAQLTESTLLTRLT